MTVNLSDITERMMLQIYHLTPKNANEARQQLLEIEERKIKLKKMIQEYRDELIHEASGGGWPNE
jgi:hypothetical protein